MQKQYKGQYNTFKFQMKFLPEGQKLFITLENKANYDLFRLTIDHDYVKDKHQWKNIIESPAQIFQYISQTFSKVVFADNGIITIAYQFGHTHRVISMELRTEKIIRDPVEILQLKFENLHKKFNQERSLLIDQIQQLKRQNTRINSQLNRKYNISEAEISQVRKESAQIKYKHQKELKQIKKQLQLNVREETDQGISGYKVQICKCFEIIDKSRFKITQSGKIINLRLDDFNEWYTYVNQNKIQVSKTFKVTVKKATKHNMYIGLATSKIKENDLKEKIKGSCLYSFWGNIYNGGIVNKINTKITTNDKFEMRFDYKQSILYFKFITKEKDQIQIVPLPAEMVNQPLHLVVKSYFKGDQLDIQVI